MEEVAARLEELLEAVCPRRDLGGLEVGIERERRTARQLYRGQLSGLRALAASCENSEEQKSGAGKCSAAGGHGGVSVGRSRQAAMRSGQTKVRRPGAPGK